MRSKSMLYWRFSGKITPSVGISQVPRGMIPARQAEVQMLIDSM
jgi:hypothetical protein